MEEQERTEQPVQPEQQEPEVEESWETHIMAKTDPLPKRVAAIAAIFIGVWNIINALIIIVNWAGGQMLSGSTGLTMLMAMLLPIGALEILAGVMLQKFIKEETPKRKEQCKGLGLIMLLVTAAFVVSSFFLSGFNFGRLLGPILAIAYLAVQKDQKAA